MTPPAVDRRLLVALAAVLAPEGAARILARAAPREPGHFQTEASRLAAAPRAERLAALGRALAAAGDLPPGSRLTVRLATAPRSMVRRADGGGDPIDDGRGLITHPWTRTSGERALARPVENEDA